MADIAKDFAELMGRVTALAEFVQAQEDAGGTLHDPATLESLSQLCVGMGGAAFALSAKSDLLAAMIRENPINEAIAERATSASALQ